MPELPSLVHQGERWPEPMGAKHGENQLQTKPLLPWMETSPRSERQTDSPHHFFMTSGEAALLLAWLHLSLGDKTPNWQ